MKKWIFTTTLIGLIYLLPLAGQPELMLSPQMLLLIGICYLIFLTQPAFSLEETRTNQQADRFSILLILLGTILTQVVSVVEWAYFHESQAWTWSPLLIVGLLLLGLGSAFRIWSIQTLGKFFTSTVARQDEQRIVQEGPYRLVRHPSYLGAYLAILGSACLLEAVVGIALSALVMFGVYRYRISAEEAFLRQEFGEDYGRYQKGTSRMIPFVW